jgi:hypothetical protein
VVLADHLRNLSWAERRTVWIDSVRLHALDEVRDKIAALIGIE